MTAYACEAELGRGPHGVVWRARSLRPPVRAVALKRLTSAAGAAAAETAAELDHPHVVPVLDVVRDGGVATVTPLARGGSLAALVFERGALEAPEVAALGAALAGALAHAHRLDVVHGGVKPANVLLCDDGAPRLADFGVARSDPPARPGRDVAPYCDPACVAGAGHRPESDVYALAAVCYQALAGAPPFTGPNAEAILAAAHAGVVRPLDEAAPGTPPALAAAIEEALDRDPAARPDAEAFAAALRAAAGVPGWPRVRGLDATELRRVALGGTG